MLSSSASSISLSALLTDEEVHSAVVRNGLPYTIENELDGFQTDQETKASALTHRMCTPSPESLQRLSQSDPHWWQSRHWRRESQDIRDLSSDQISLPSAVSGDPGSSCGSDADKVPTVFTPVTVPGSSCGSHLTSISQVLQRSNSSAGALGDVSTSSHRKRKYNTTKNGKRNDVRARDQRNVRRRLLVDSDELTKVLASECCSGNCLRNHIVFSELSDIRKSVEGLLQVQRNQVIMQCIASGLKQDTVAGRHVFPLPHGKAVCSNALALIYGISIRTVRTLTANVKNGSCSTLRMPRTRGTNVWRTYLVPFLEKYAEDYGSAMPHNSKTELCVGAKIQIYYKFQILVEGNPELLARKELSVSWFYFLWKKFCPNIICPRRNSFTKCDQCCSFKEAIEKLTDRPLRLLAVEKFDRHLQDQMLERKQYYENRMHAMRHPTEAVSMIIDGMAQHTTNLPVFPKGRPKSASQLQTYNLHVMGVLIHGYSPVVYLHDSTVPTGPNMLCEVLWRAIQSLPVQKLPPVLYLQLDNTASDNKNHWVFEFITMLVQQRIFREVFF